MAVLSSRVAAIVSHHGVSIADPTAPATDYTVHDDPYDTAKPRADARSMLAQRNHTHPLANTEGEGYDSGAEEVVDIMPL